MHRFWLHRYLTGRGDTNYVVDSASIEVDRRARRTKTDAVDLRGLLALLARYVAGDRRCWRVVRVPSVAEEDARQLHRTWETLQGDRTRVINRLKAVLASHGVRLAITADFLEHVAATRVWDGSEIPSGARQRLAHDWAQLHSIEEQLAAVKAARARLRIDPIDRRRRVYFYGALGCVARGIPRVEIRDGPPLIRPLPRRAIWS